MTYLDDELDRILDDQTGQYSHEDVQAAKGWHTTWERRWEAQSKTLAAEREQEAKAKQDRLYEHIRATQKEADANKAALEAGDMSVADFLNRSARLKARADEYDRRLAGLGSATSLIDAMRGDPVGFQDSFFDKWTVLQRHRPSIDTWIHEARIKRRNAQRSRSK